jgi:type II secretory pathway pseudopilin PulG
LIELLVVISIIALLVSILLPALQKARQSAMEVQCLSRKRSVAMAIQYYRQDNKHYPFKWDGRRYDSEGSWMSFSAEVAEYLGAAERDRAAALRTGMLYCPFEEDNQANQVSADPPRRQVGANTYLVPAVDGSGQAISAYSSPDFNGGEVSDALTEFSASEVLMVADGKMNFFRFSFVNGRDTPSKLLFAHGRSGGYDWTNNNGELPLDGRGAGAFKDGHATTYTPADFPDPDGIGPRSWLVR